MININVEDLLNNRSYVWEKQGDEYIVYPYFKVTVHDSGDLKVFECDGGVLFETITLPEFSLWLDM